MGGRLSAEHRRHKHVRIRCKHTHLGLWHGSLRSQLGSEDGGGLGVPRGKPSVALGTPRPRPRGRGQQGLQLP
jgi:hypothetical protein